MDAASYSAMQTDVCYHAYYSLGGKCVIKKSAVLEGFGLLKAKLDNGQVVERHYSFFTWLLSSPEIDPFV